MVSLSWVLLAVTVSAPKAMNPDKHDVDAVIELNGEKTEVRWTDGDSFKVKSGPFKGRGTRLHGYNTLEAFGPVHRWGEWTAAELFTLAKDASTVAAAKEWVCTTGGKEDRYKRLLINCPELTVHIVKEGYALAYAVDGAPGSEVLAAQKEAIASKRGIWRRGVVNGVITSVHSAGEDEDETEGAAYNRVVDTRTGLALKHKHEHRYASCEEVCETTEGTESCMVYVPFKHRYRHRPSCLFVR